MFTIMSLVVEFLDKEYKIGIYTQVQIHKKKLKNRKESKIVPFFTRLTL